jgi:hypothetical protein
MNQQQQQPPPIQPLPRGQEIPGMRARIFQVRSRADQFYRVGKEVSCRAQRHGRAEKQSYISIWNRK